MRGTPPTHDGGPVLVPLLILGVIIAVVTWVAVTWIRTQEDRDAFLKSHAPLLKVLWGDAVAVAQLVVRPWRLRRVKGPSDEDLQKLLDTPPKYRPDQEQVSKVRRETIPCIICGTPIPNGGRLCQRCEEL